MYVYVTCRAGAVLLCKGRHPKKQLKQLINSELKAKKFVDFSCVSSVSGMSGCRMCE